MRIDHVRIEKHPQQTVLLADCLYQDTAHEIFYAVESQFGQYLDDDSADAFVLAALIRAMAEGEDLEVNYPISSKLYYHLNTYLIPYLANVDQQLTLIKIKPLKGYNDKQYHARAVATGISCGIDSFYTVLRNLEEDVPQSSRLTHLVLNRHQHETEFSHAQLSISDKDQERLEVGQELGLIPVYVWTNVDQFINFPYEQICTFHDLSVGLSLKKLISTYYYASSFTLKDFHPTFAAAPYYDPLNSLAIQTESFQMLTHAVHEERIDKTAFLAKYPIVQQHLDVCFYEHHDGHKKNCTWCEKCVRTTMALHALGELDKFNTVFDLDLFQKDYNQRVGEVAYRAYVNKVSFDRDIMHLMRQNHKEIPLTGYAWMVRIGVQHQMDKIKAMIHYKSVQA